MSGNNSGELLKKEIAIMKKINHPNLLTLYEVIEDAEAKKMYMVMEYIDWGPLMSKKHMIAIDCETDFFPEDKLRYYMRSFLSGLDYLHRIAKVVHLDIKPDNILVNDKNIVKIADFGISTMIDDSETLKKVGGTR